MRVTCLGFTKKGNPCKNIGSIGTYKQFCRYHLSHDDGEPQTCNGTTLDGNCCTLITDNSNFCGLHEEKTTLFLIKSPNGIRQGFFNNLKDAERCSKELQTTYGVSRYFQIHRLQWSDDDHYLSEDMSGLKIDVIIAIINEYMGKGYIWITLKTRFFSYIRSLTPRSFDYISGKVVTKHTPFYDAEGNYVGTRTRVDKSNLGERKYVFKLNTLYDVSDL
uniref:Zn-finger protein n=1 Tax=Pithovirus LCPAC401 TaxID=2506595 RepID=A0A481ZBT0_9VIRU|nr:MAG: Zn-finger protein [Pithovirus LCPAC401]